MPPLVIAHRGASAHHAEHTRAAYLRALDDGADGLECDVQLTRDKEVVCWHDPTVDRTSDARGGLHEFTLAQLRGLDVAGWHPGTARRPAAYGRAAEQLLTLHELVEIALGAGRPLKLAVELKHPSPFGRELEEQVMRVLAAAGWDPETSMLGSVQVSFMSFDPAALRYVAPLTGPDALCALMDRVPALAQIPDVRFSRTPLLRVGVRAAMVSAVQQSETLVWTGGAQLAGPSVAYLREHLADGKAWLAAGRRLRVWTADSDDDVAFLAAHGVQEITTNRPGEVARMLRRGALAASAG
ncbi:MAG: glycerophosphodiester phosphodiesterase family protein [Micrococcus sp.]|nr:glycerophosphodiester phosphodiesterase family protein [Micrococcus sp.]